MIDVRANRGQFAAFLRQQVGNCGRIVSFEPIAAHVAHLRAAAKGDSLWKVAGCALGRAEGQAELNVMTSDVFSFFLTPADVMDPTLLGMNTIARTEVVTLRTLDAVAAELGLDLVAMPTAVKLDTQGFDLEVLAGAADTLGKARCVQCEVCVTPLYQGMPDMTQSLQTFRGLGFQPAGLFAVTRDRSLAAVEFDAVLVPPLLER